MVDRVRNVEIREELNQEGVLEKVKRSQERWRGMGAEKLARRVYEAEMEDRGGRGWPRKNGLIILSNDMLMLHVNLCKSKNMIY